MKQRIRDFLFKKIFFKKGIKILKKKKGFSLIEVLVGVAIIGIISGIAVPQFLKHRENAARVAANTSASNIVKAFKQCLILNSFSDCNELGKIDISCPRGHTCVDEELDPRFCASITKGQTAQNASGEFSVCVSVSGATETRTYGGNLISGDVKVCHITNGGGNSCGTNGALNGKSHTGGAIKVCTNASPDCNNHGSVPSGCTIAGRTCSNISSTGKCDSTGNCI